MEKLKPGMKAPYWEQYEIIGSHGGRTGEERTTSKGERLPPTPESGQRYQIVDRTKNKIGRG